MTIEALTRAQFARELGYVDAGDDASPRAIARSMRAAMRRWGLCPKRALLKHARDQLRAGDVPTDTVPQVLERLVALGECAEVAIGHETYIAPAEPRWIGSGGGLAVMLGPVDVPPEIARVEPLEPTDLALRVQVVSEEQAAMLEARGARQVSLGEWLHPPGYLRHVARRSGDAVRIDRFDLVTFWERLTAAVAEEGLQVDRDAEIRFLVGAPGGFFGRHAAPTLEGRWQDSAPDGIWCAYRRGHGEAHWLPTLVSVDGDDRRAFDLFDEDEWRWALLARSRAIGPEEIIRRSGNEVQITWPLPSQLRAALDIVGVPSGRWRWRVAAEAPDLWALFS
jgi:hypothetical protein